MDLPVGYPTLADAYDFPHTLGSRAKRSVAKKPANVLGNIVSSNFEKHQAVPRMEQSWMIKTVVVSEEGWSLQGVEQGNNVFAVFHPYMSGTPRSGVML
jgi:hypothetical protein